MYARNARFWLLPALVLASSASFAESPDTGTITPEIARRVVDEVKTEVARIRGLEFVEDVAVEVIDDAGAREHMMGRLEAFDQLEKLEIVTAAYRMLGMIDEDRDPLDVILDVLEEQAGGFYDPPTKTYYLLSDMPAATASLFTAHELTHALEDQHFDLDTRLRDVIDDDDRLFARSAVHEGSATLLMTAWATQAAIAGRLDPAALSEIAAGEAGKAEKLMQLPEVLRRQLIGPYVLGASFLARGNMLAASMQFPVESIDTAYRDLPESSEQILHPEKYWDPEQRDEPTAVGPFRPGRSLGRGWSRVGEGHFGELTIAAMVGGTTPSDPMALAMPDPSTWTHEAAAGWDGDRWELWSRRGRQVLLVATVWDTPADAAEFSAAIEALPGVSLERVGKRVAFVAGASGRRAERLLSRLLK